MKKIPISISQKSFDGLCTPYAIGPAGHASISELELSTLFRVSPNQRTEAVYFYFAKQYKPHPQQKGQKICFMRHTI